MSLWDDYCADGMFERDFPHGLDNDEWVTVDGRRLKLCEMTERHIRNVMRMIGVNDGFYSACEKELRSRALGVVE